MRARRRIALLVLGCAAAASLFGSALGVASPTRWGSGSDLSALSAQAEAAVRHRCVPRAHASHSHKRCSHKPRHGASSTKPTAGPAPASGGSGSAGGSGGSGGLTPTLPGVPGPGGGSLPVGSGEEGGTPPTVVHVQVVAVEYHFTLSRTTVPAGKVALQFVNDGQDEHNLNVLSGEGEVEGAFPKTVSQGIREQTMTLRKGTFTLFCSLPEHEAKGMHANLTVE
jgi:plastocyanin